MRWGQLLWDGRIQRLGVFSCRKMKTLAADDDDEESAMAWVMKSRKLEEDRLKADQRVRGERAGVG